MPMTQDVLRHTTERCRMGHHSSCPGATVIRRISGEITADRAERLICTCSCHQAVSR